MSRRIGLRLAGVLLVVVAGFGAWWVMSTAVSTASGFHVVDGYWLGPESRCTDSNSPSYCDSAVQAATPVLAAQRPGAVVVRAAVAPPSCSPTTYTICTTAGLYKGVFVVFDLSDGSRQAIGLICEGTVTEGSEVVRAPDCRPYALTNQ